MANDATWNGCRVCMVQKGVYLNLSYIND